MATESTTATRPVALVTGASAGLGKVFAERLAASGHDLAIVARDEARLRALGEDLSKRHGARVEVLVADLVNGAAREAVAERVSRGVDYLVNNAGFGTVGEFARLPAEREVDEVELNVVTLSRLTRAALPRMLERKRGRVINVASMAGLAPGPFTATYSATKAFVVSLSESLAEEVRGSGVRVMALCPGFTRTEFQSRASMSVGHVPKLVWMDAEPVVDSALAAIERGEVVHIPGAINRLTREGMRFVPRRLTARIVAATSKRFGG